MSMLIVTLIIIGLQAALLPSQETAARLEQQDVKRWERTLREGDLREKALVVARLEQATLVEGNIELIRNSFLPLLVEELRNIKRLRSHPPSKRWLYDNAEWLGEYQGNILFLLGKIADESAVEILVEYLHTGRGVADSLVRIGMPAVKAILEKLKENPKAYTGGFYALTRIAEEELKRKSLQNLKIYRDVIVPELDRLCREDEAQQLALKYAQVHYQPESVGSMVKALVERIRESCSEDLPKIKVIVGLPTR